MTITPNYTRTVDRPALLAAVSDILVAIGEDPDREGLRETPRRVADMYLEMFDGLGEDPTALIESAIFNEPEAGELVTVADISFDSMCEHHLLPFRGHVTVSYAPAGGRVVGLSKLARVVDTVARRPQVQERMTRQILDAVAHSALQPAGVLVEVEAEHLCMSVRGVRKQGAITRTAARWGSLATPG
ncbi:MAG: GTP cyclohydrolase I FolE [Actinomycetota bacterium]